MTQEQMVEHYKLSLDAQREDAHEVQRQLARVGLMNARTTYTTALHCPATERTLRSTNAIELIGEQISTLCVKHDALANAHKLVIADVKSSQQKVVPNKRKELLAFTVTRGLDNELNRTYSELSKREDAYDAMKKYKLEHERCMDFEGGIQK